MREKMFKDVQHYVEKTTLSRVNDKTLYQVFDITFQTN